MVHLYQKCEKKIFTSYPGIKPVTLYIETYFDHLKSYKGYP